MHQGNRYNLVDIAIPPTGDFILLETINKDKTATRTIYIIMPTPDKSLLRLGRGHEADVRISDISVSRLHAQIKCSPDGYFLEDNHAKFGTLYYHPEAVQLENDPLRTFQVGRTVISVVQKPANAEPDIQNQFVLINGLENKPNEASPSMPSSQLPKSIQKPSQGNGDSNQMEDIQEDK